MLTRKQKELLFLIRDRLAEDGVPPSFDEMKLALGLRSKSGIHRLITALEERGFIKRLPHRARALEVLRMPEAKDWEAGEKDSGSLGRPARSFGGEGRGGDVPAHIAQAVLSLPLYGRIAAGTPIEALADPSRFIDVPVGLLASRRGGGGAQDEHYALEISGDSMIDAGILDGDQVVIRKADRVENGAIAVALVDDAEATLKYIQKRADGVALIPANKNYETRVLSPSRVKIQGQLVGLVRRY